MTIETKLTDAIVGLKEAYVTKAAEVHSRLDRVERMTGQAEAPSLADRLFRADGFSDFARGSREMLALEVPTLELKAYVEAPLAVQFTHWPAPAEGPTRRRWVRDLLAREPTTRASIEYPVEDTYTINAAPQDGPGSTIGQSGLVMERITRPVQTISHWLSVTKELLADSGPFDAFVRSRLIYGAMLAEEEQIISGDGTAGQLHGILSSTGHQAYARGQAGDGLLETLSRALAQVEMNDLQPTGIALHPDEWEQIRAEIDVRQGYRLWGLTVVVTKAVPAGTFIVGDFARGAVLFERETATVEMTDRHQNDFIEHKIAVRCNLRSSLVVTNPAGIIAGDFPS